MFNLKDKVFSSTGKDKELVNESEKKITKLTEEENLCRFCKSDNVLDMTHIEEYKPKERIIICRSCGLTSFYNIPESQKRKFWK
jgi:superfamily II helicase